MPSRKWPEAVKRFTDIVISATLLIATAPIVFAAILTLTLTSPGPVFYLGKRCGKDEKQFTCFKLRTMHVNPDAILREKGLSSISQDGRLLVFDDDPRIGKVGRCLRKFSIDELPQLWNVLSGEMSLIGPRPLPLSMLDRFPQIRALRSVVRPGISGLWQIRNRQKNASVLDMVDDDLEYIRTFSLTLDLKIAWATIPKIIEPPGGEGQPRKVDELNSGESV